MHPRHQGFDGKNYIDNLFEEVKKGMREKAEQGGFPGKVPVGCINNKETHLVEIDPQMAPFIRKLYQWYASGMYSLTDLRHKCVEQGSQHDRRRSVAAT